MIAKKYQGIKRDLKVKRSKSGLGLFTLAPIKKGEFVIEYVGDIIDNKEADKRGGMYLFQTNKNRFIDGSSRKNIARYVNHACKPNCEIDIIKGHVIILSKRNIKAGEELNYDYDTEFFVEHIEPYGCRCSSCKK